MMRLLAALASLLLLLLAWPFAKASDTLSKWGVALHAYYVKEKK